MGGECRKGFDIELVEWDTQRSVKNRGIIGKSLTLGPNSSSTHVHGLIHRLIVSFIPSENSKQDRII
ncbi:hypothetical protein AN958_12683 [Leucoagaricus sp. SymC.cos]|nr:hypothetical protein AN958_12683 [Leucoagaricus sp. SymC.cos]